MSLYLRRPMRRLAFEGHLIDRRFRRRWINYLFQCGIAALALLLIATDLLTGSDSDPRTYGAAGIVIEAVTRSR